MQSAVALPRGSAGRQTLVATERSPTTIHATGAEVKCQLHTLAGVRPPRALRAAGPLGCGWCILDALDLRSQRPQLGEEVVVATLNVLDAPDARRARGA